MKSFVKFLLFYAVVALSPSLYSMHDYDFSGGTHHTVDFGRPAVTLSPHDSFDDLLARHMGVQEHSETHTSVSVRHTTDEDDFWGTSGSLPLGSREVSPVATHEDPDEDLTSLSDLTTEQHADVWMKKNIEGDASAKAAAKQYRQQNRAAQPTVVATDDDSLRMTDTVEVPIPAAEENRSLVPTAAVDSEALASAKQQGKQQVEDMLTVPEGQDPSKMMEFLGIDVGSVMAPDLRNATPAQQKEHLQKVKQVFDQAFDKKITELEGSRDSASDELERERFDGMVEALRAKKAEIEEDLERYEEGDEEEVAPEQTDDTVAPTAKQVAAEEAAAQKEAEYIVTPQEAEQIKAEAEAIGKTKVTSLETAAQVREYLNLPDGEQVTKQEVEQAINAQQLKLAGETRVMEHRINANVAAKDAEGARTSYRLQVEAYSEEAALYEQKERLIDLVMADAPTATVTPEATTADVTPMTRQEALRTLRLKDRRMPDGRIILSRPEIEDAYSKRREQLMKDLSGEALGKADENLAHARKVLIDEVDSRIDDHNKQVREQVAVVRDVLGAKFKDNPNIKARDRQVIEQGFTRVATRVAEQVVKRGETFNPANPEHATRLEQSMMQEINSNPQFKAALADPDVDSALEQASKNTGGSSASRSVAREARKSYGRQKMYDDVDATLKKAGIGIGVVALLAIASAIVYELIDHNVIPV